jgi:Na+/melibiose symporter-like transporter
MIHSSSDSGAPIFAILLVTCFLPTIIAWWRGHRAMLAILMMNLIGLGALLVGAVAGSAVVFAAFALIGFAPSTVIMLIALIWALGPDTRLNERREAEGIASAIMTALAKREADTRLSESLS